MESIPSNLGGSLVMPNTWSRMSERLRSKTESDLRQFDASLALMDSMGVAVAVVEPSEQGGFMTNRRASIDLARMEEAGTVQTLSRLDEILRAEGREVILLNGYMLAWKSMPMLDQEPVELKWTPREKEIAGWLCEGKKASEIGIILGLSARTVEKHLQNLYRKAGVSNASQLMGTMEGRVGA